jgi:hypothetical protein
MKLPLQKAPRREFDKKGCPTTPAKPRHKFARGPLLPCEVLVALLKLLPLLTWAELVGANMGAKNKPCNYGIRLVTILVVGPVAVKPEFGQPRLFLHTPRGVCFKEGFSSIAGSVGGVALGPVLHIGTVGVSLDRVTVEQQACRSGKAGRFNLAFGVCGGIGERYAGGEGRLVWWIRHKYLLRVREISLLLPDAKDVHCIGWVEDIKNQAASVLQERRSPEFDGCDLVGQIGNGPGRDDQVEFAASEGRLE